MYGETFRKITGLLFILLLVGAETQKIHHHAVLQQTKRLTDQVGTMWVRPQHDSKTNLYEQTKPVNPVVTDLNLQELSARLVEKLKAMKADVRIQGQPELLAKHTTVEQLDRAPVLQAEVRGPSRRLSAKRSEAVSTPRRLGDKSVNRRGLARVVPFMLVMLASGSLNTLLMKFVSTQKAPPGSGLDPIGFDHPFIVPFVMMIGETVCLLGHLATKKKPDVGALALKDMAAEIGNLTVPAAILEAIAPPKRAPMYCFAVACLFDWTATTLTYLAISDIPPSVVQMTRGSIVIFTCLFSRLLLQRKQSTHHLAGVALVFIGIMLVSLSALLTPNGAAVGTGSSLAKTIIGISLCVVAQIFQSTMLVWEERILNKYNTPPLQVVGMEGSFGLCIGVVVMTVAKLFQVETPITALYQIGHSFNLALGVFGFVFSIAFFNFSGVTVTQRASAVARSTIMCMTTVIIWAMELAFGWNTFKLLQLIGFIVLTLGTAVYNNMIVIQLKSGRTSR